MLRRVVTALDSLCYLIVQAQVLVSRAESELAQDIEQERRVTFRGLPGCDAVKIVKSGASGKRVIEVPFSHKALLCQTLAFADARRPTFPWCILLLCTSRIGQSRIHSKPCMSVCVMIAFLHTSGLHVLRRYPARLPTRSRCLRPTRLHHKRKPCDATRRPTSHASPARCVSALRA